MEKYYRLVSYDLKNSSWLNIHIENLRLPYYGSYFSGRFYRVVLKRRSQDNYYWFTEKWFKEWVSKYIYIGQTICILRTNQEPYYCDGQQATFKYNGSEKSNKISVFSVVH